MERCLYCYKELADGERDFHKSCSKKIFGTPEAPLLPYTRANIAELAREVIRSQTTLTGVQAKLSLDIAKAGKGTPERFTIVGLRGRYILKPQTEHYPHLPELEDLTMHMAEAAKMQVVPTRSSALPTGSCATSHAASTEGLTAKNIRWKISANSLND